jgi:hypothetical protein
MKAPAGDTETLLEHAGVVQPCRLTQLEAFHVLAHARTAKA